jgi:Flp pilus assembly pilin Flp
MIKNFVNKLTSQLPEREEGQGTIEYVLVLGVIVVGIFGLVQWGGLGTAISGALGAVTGLFTGANPIG